VSGDIAVVGAFGDDAKAGSAYVFRRDEGGSDPWGQVAKLAAWDAESGDDDLFGGAVSVTGDVLLVAAEGDDFGSAYVFQRELADVDSWRAAGKLTEPDAEPSYSFGSPVSASGDVAVLGAPYDDDGGTSSGSAYVARILAAPQVEGHATSRPH
jgi:hypothetical protein